MIVLPNVFPPYCVHISAEKSDPQRWPRVPQQPITN